MRQHSRLLTAIILHGIPLTVDRGFTLGFFATSSGLVQD